MCVCVYNVHTCLISQQRQQQYAVKILSHVAATRQSAPRQRLPPVYQVCFQMQVKAAQFPIRYEIWRAPKNVRLRACMCVCVRVAAYVINSAGKHAYKQTAASQQGEGDPDRSRNMRANLFFCFLFYARFVFYYSSCFVLFRQATFQLFPFPLSFFRCCVWRRRCHCRQFVCQCVCVCLYCSRIILNCLLLWSVDVSLTLPIIN